MVKVTPSFDQVSESVRGLIATMKSVPAFTIKNPIKGFMMNMADSIEAGKKEEAAKWAVEFVSVGRSILGKFIRNSVIDQTSDEGTPLPSHFSKLIKQREDDHYDEDIIARLRKLSKELEEAVKAETNGTFELRVTAYNVMTKALTESDVEQTRRDRVRQVQMQASHRAANGAKKPSAPAAVQATSKFGGSEQRAAMLQERKKQADEYRNLI